MQQTILITGATSGLGRHAALYLAARDFRVIAAGRRVPALESLRAESGDRIETIVLDVCDAQSIAAAKQRVDVITAGEGLDVLVNNAGYGQLGPLEMISDGDLRKQFDTNVFGLMAVTRAFLPAMRERGRGRVLNVSSVGGRLTFPFGGAYHATKYAVEAMSDALRRELRGFGIDVVLIEPGAIRTEFSDVAMDTVPGLGDSASPYAPLLEKADKIKATTDRYSGKPISVSKAIYRAITARRPKARYVAPAVNSAMIWLFTRAMPTRWADRLMLRLLGLPPAVQKLAAAN